MAPKAIFVLAAAVLLAVQLVATAAVDHPVGGDGSWDASGTNYNAWAATHKIVQGDTISFKYPPSHDVVEVTKAGYDACSGSSPVKTYSGGNTVVKLTTPGKRYFICSVTGHCAAGMKLALTVAAAGAAPAPTKSTPRYKTTPPPAAEAPAAPPSSSTEVSTTPTAAPAPRSSSDAAGVGGGVLGAKAVVGIAAAVAVALAM